MMDYGRMDIKEMDCLSSDTGEYAGEPGTDPCYLIRHPGASCSGTPALETRWRRTKAASTIRLAAFTSAYV